MATKATVTELEVLFTANTKPVDDAAKQVEDRAKKIEKNPVKQKVDGDDKGAMAAMDRVEAEAKKIVSAKTMATVDANIDRAETSLSKVQERLDYLRSVDGEMEVTADIKKAEAALKQITRRRDALVSAKESMVVDANTAPAEAALGDLADDAGEAGAEGGDAAGKGLGDGISEALKAIPVAGGILLAAVAIGKSVLDGINDGLQVEVRQDRLEALTGITEDDAARFAMAAGEAYASNFGESIEQNMDTARLAIQSGLLDEGATLRQSESVIKGLAGIADVLGEDVQPVATAVTQLLRTGLVKSADEAFDVIAAGARNGVNVTDDMLDTLTEYPALFSRLGLSGEDALGLINQGLKSGARNSDLVADALKEFQIRATDASDSSAAGFKAIGLNAEEMTAKIAAGGAGAREGLDQVLDGLNAMEDPVARNAAGVALFGTQWEDMGSAMGALDLSTAVAQLGQVQGAAQAMFDTLADNDASKLEEAQRNVEVAMNGIKGALAGAFSEPLGDAAEWVSANRGPLLEFFSGLVNGALDFGVALVNGIAGGIEVGGRFVAGPLADMVDGIASILNGLDFIPGIGTGDAEQSMRDLADGMRDADEAAEDTADNLRESLIPGIEDARDRFNEMFNPQINMGYLNDRTRELATAVSEVGYAADGSAWSVEALAVAQDGMSTSNQELHEQLTAVSRGLADQLAAAQEAGEGQEDLVGRYNTTRDALIAQLEQMGIARGQAEGLANTYLSIPGGVNTNVTADTTDANNVINNFLNTPRSLTITASVVGAGAAGLIQLIQENAIGNAIGNHLLPMAAGGALTPMPAIGTKVPPNTWRVVGDRMDVPEWYIPQDGSARSKALAFDAARALGVLPMADGGSLHPTTQALREGPMVQVTVERVVEGTPRDVGHEVGWALLQAGRGIP